MPITVLYRKASNEVLKISLNGQLFDDRDTTFFGVLTDPDFPDGTGPVRELLPDDSWGDLRVLGYAKIAEPGTGANGTVRLATQPEIDGFAALETDDTNQMDANRVSDWVDNHPQFRKFFKAFADINIDEFNIVRQWIMSFKAEVAAATSLADLQARVAALSDLPDRNLTQLRDAMIARISKDD